MLSPTLKYSPSSKFPIESLLSSALSICTHFSEVEHQETKNGFRGLFTEDESEIVNQHNLLTQLKTYKLNGSDTQLNH